MPGWADKHADKMVVRTLEVLRMIAESGSQGLTIAELQELTGRSRSTVYRDLELIDAAGWPLQREHEQASGNRVYYYMGKLR